MKLAVLFLLTAATPALAQSDAGRYGQPALTADNRVDFMLMRFAACAGEATQGLTDRILAAPLASDEEATAVRKLASTKRDCAQVYPLPFTSTAVRNALAIAAYRRKHRDENSVPTVPAPSSPPSFAIAAPGATGTDQQQVAWFMAAIAKCVVYVDLPSAHRLILGPVDVAEENKRFAALAPAIAKCMPAGGPTLDIRLFRGFLGNALLARVGGAPAVKG